MGVTAKAAYEARLEKLKERQHGLTFSEALDYLQEIDPNERTIYKRSLFARLHKTLGPLPIQGIKASHLDILKTELAGYSRNSQKFHYGLAKRAIKAVSKDGLYHGQDPFQVYDLKATGLDVRCYRFLTLDEANLLLKALSIQNPMWRDMAYLSLKTGIRLTELYNLKGSDLQPDGNAIIKSKSGEREVLYLPSDCSDLIRSLGPGYLFISGRRTYKQFYRVVAKLGLNDHSQGKADRVWFHTLRHTFASWLVQSGVDIYRVQKYMRHKSVTMTERYAHLNKDLLIQGLKLIQDWNLERPEPQPQRPF
jgi:integrase